MFPHSVTTRTTPTGPVLTIRDDLDAVTAPATQEEIANLTVTGGQLLVVDLSEVSLCDSSGISALIAARNVALAANAGIALAAVPGRITRTLGLVGLAAFFPSHPSAEHAIAARLPASDTAPDRPPPS